MTIGNKSQFFSIFNHRYKSVILVGVTSFFVYVSYKIMSHLFDKLRAKPDLTVEQIRKIIEDLPYENKNSETNLTLKDLLDDLKDLNEDEEWKRLITSLQNFYTEDNNK